MRLFFHFRKEQIMEAVEKVLETLKKAGKPLSAGQVADISGIDRKQVDKAMKELKENGSIVSPKRCYWEPV